MFNIRFGNGCVLESIYRGNSICFGRFNADRVTSGIAKLKSARKNVSQKRMDR